MGIPPLQLPEAQLLVGIELPAQFPPAQLELGIEPIIGPETVPPSMGPETCPPLTSPVQPSQQQSST
ncbi:MAG: hypothetical protein JSS02_26875 [Planctomycetes bacterium]|nr:hypothetical protein [Planctomycetota bacterium]